MPHSKSIYLKFLWIQIPVFLLTAAIGLYFLSNYKVRLANDELSTRVGASISRIGGLVAELDLPAETETANRLMGLLLADKAIACAELLSADKPTSVSAPRRTGCKGVSPDQWLTVQAGSQDELQLRIGITTAEVVEAQQSSRDIGLLQAAFSILLAGFAASFAFRNVVSKPITRLVGGIREATRSGKTVYVEVQSPDEIGTVVDAFNSLQERIDAERKLVTAARDRLGRIYNVTPALLFTTNLHAVLLHVSDFWLAATGYTRDDILGQSIESLLDEPSAMALKGSVFRELAHIGEVCDVPLKMFRRNGEEMEVLFSAIADGTDEHGMPIFVCIMSDVTKLRMTEADLTQLARTDTLTKLPNRNWFFGHLLDTMEKRLRVIGQAEEPAIAVMLIDLDNFKWVNDTFGHPAGDKLLIEVAARIGRAVGPENSLVRLGGDEFAVIVTALNGETEVCLIAQAICSAIAPAIDLDGAVGYVGASIGIAFADAQTDTPAELVRQADQAMYSAKKNGKNRYHVYNDADRAKDKASSGRLKLIEQGMTDHLFSLAFQPIIDLRSMKVAGVEALLRLRTPDGNPEAIETIIRLAEESGQMDRLGGWILRQAAHDFADLFAASGNPDFYISINLSAHQLHKGLLVQLREVTAACPEIRSHLVFEITETAAIKSFDLVSALLRDVRALGARIAIDDFGTGYSSMSYISRLPVDMIKLDRSYIASLDPDHEPNDDQLKQLALIRATTLLGTELGMKLVAEGIETESVADQIRSIGIDFGQGYCFSRPLPKSVAIDWLTIQSGKSLVSEKAAA